MHSGVRPREEPRVVDRSDDAAGLGFSRAAEGEDLISLCRPRTYWRGFRLSGRGERLAGAWRESGPRQPKKTEPKSIRDGDAQNLPGPGPGKAEVGDVQGAVGTEGHRRRE